MTFTMTNAPNGVIIVSVDGQLIVANRNELKDKVLKALEDGESKVVLDFLSTEYIDSSGLGVLVSVSKKIREAGGELRLAGLNEDLRMLFELTKLDTLFKICNTADEAVQSFWDGDSAAAAVCPASGSGESTGNGRRPAHDHHRSQRTRDRGTDSRYSGSLLPGVRPLGKSGAVQPACGAVRGVGQCNRLREQTRSGQTCTCDASSTL